MTGVQTCALPIWVPFNEGWGQFDAAEVCRRNEAIDRTRVVDPASGWHDQKIGKLRSDHVYFRPYRFRADRKGRAVALSEFGGYAHKVIGHEFSRKSFGYKSFVTPAQLELALEDLYQEEVRPAIAQGLCAAVYTQMSDVEDEINGLLTYDRKVVKVAPERMRALMRGIGGMPEPVKPGDMKETKL